MKKLVLVIALLLVAYSDVYAQVEYKVITSVESIVTSGAGRSRIISALEDKDYKEFTSIRTDDKKNDNRN